MLFDQIPATVSDPGLARRVRVLARRHGGRRRRNGGTRSRRRSSRSRARVATPAGMEPHTQTDAEPDSHDHHGEQREDGEEGEPRHAADPFPLGRRAADGYGVRRGLDGLEAAPESAAGHPLLGPRAVVAVAVVLAPPRRVLGQRRVLLRRPHGRRVRDGFRVRAGVGGIVLHAVGLDNLGGVVGAPIGLVALLLHFGRGGVRVTVFFGRAVHG